MRWVWPWLLVLSLGLTAQADTWSDQLAEAAAAVEAAQSTRAKQDALTELISIQEAALSDLRAQVRDLAIREGGARAALEAQEDDTAAALAVLQRVSRSEAPLPLVHPDGAVAAARAAMLAEGLSQALAEEQAQLADQLAATRTSREALEMAQARLDQLRADTRETRAALISGAPTSGVAPSASTLAGLLDELPQQSSPTDTSKRAWPLPIAGSVTRTDEGWMIRPSDSTLVRAPTRGLVLFAGPLRGYRTVVVIEVGPGQSLVLGGLQAALVSQGQRIQTSDALGLLPAATDISPNTHTNVTQSAFPAGDLPPDALYMEARDGDGPLDPSQWFALQEDG
ncbi:MAG: peptidoglycan DD-metalloendopeptidase family protein [Pseudomonadota bacterium]